jgi:hypothetical protein
VEPCTPFKGLIQFAGAFVHLQKQRPRPALKLFRLAAAYLAEYPSPHLALNVANILRLAKRSCPKMKLWQ